MKFIGITAVLAAFSIVGQAHALDATNTWRGSVIVTNETAACNKPGMPSVGQTLLTVFRPKMANTDPPDGILVSFNNGALLITPLAPPPSGSYSADFLNGLATYQHYTGGTFAVAVKPTNITETTPQITVSGKFTKFRNVVGCTLSFKGSFFKGTAP
jgi:hypothetical protein